MWNSVQDCEGTLSCFSIRKAKMPGSEEPEQQTGFWSSVFLHSSWNLWWGNGVPEASAQFYAFCKKGSVRSKTYFISSWGICKTLTCSPIIIMLVWFPKWTLFILKEALLCNQEYWRPEVLAFEWFWLSFKINIYWIWSSGEWTKANGKGELTGSCSARLGP